MKVGDLVSVLGSGLYLGFRTTDRVDKIGIVVNVLTDPYDGGLCVDVIADAGLKRYMEREVKVLKDEEA